MSSESGDRLCGDWAWDPVLRELRHYQRKGKGWESEPDAVERLQPVRSVTWYRWSQAPMASTTGQVMPGIMSRIVVAYEGGGNLTVNESDRGCAETLARAIASAYRLEVAMEGAPDGRRAGNVPPRDAMGRLVNRTGKLEVILDLGAGEIVVSRGRFPAGKSRRRIRTAEVRRLELSYEVRGPQETFAVWAIVGAEEERLPVASYTGFEGWADAGEWRDYTLDLARSLGVEAKLDV